MVKLRSRLWLRRRPPGMCIGLSFPFAAIDAAVLSVRMQSYHILRHSASAADKILLRGLLFFSTWAFPFPHVGFLETSIGILLSYGPRPSQPSKHILVETACKSPKFLQLFSSRVSSVFDLSRTSVRPSQKMLWPWPSPPSSLLPYPLRTCARISGAPGGRRPWGQPTAFAGAAACVRSAGSR